MRAVALGALLLVGCASSRPVERIVPTPKATPSPSPSPTPEPTPVPTPVPTAVPVRPASAAPRPQAAPVHHTGNIRSVSSTAYCLTGTMASGRKVYWGAVAMNGVPFKSKWLVHDGPMAGATLIVEDRIGHSSEFDVAMPGNCTAARNYGRRRIRVERVA